MASVILPWNPAEQEWPGTYAADLETVRIRGVLRRSWGMPLPTPRVDDTEVWLVVMGSRPAMQGLIGHGVALRSTESDDPVRSAAGTIIDFDVLLAHGDQVPLELISVYLPEAPPLVPFLLEAAAEAALRGVWAEENGPAPGTVDPIPGAMPLSCAQRVQVNRFEHDPDLRASAVAHHGSACHACGLDGEQVYGPAGHDLIQVHHTAPLRHLTDDYDVDPLVDLVPLCPTCHVVVHSRWPHPYSVEQVRSMLRDGGHLRGTVMTDEQLESEAAAARILGARVERRAPEG